MRFPLISAGFVPYDIRSITKGQNPLKRDI